MYQNHWKRHMSLRRANSLVYNAKSNNNINKKTTTTTYNDNDDENIIEADHHY